MWCGALMSHTQCATLLHTQYVVVQPHTWYVVWGSTPTYTAYSVGQKWLIYSMHYGTVMPHAQYAIYTMLTAEYG